MGKVNLKYMTLTEEVAEDVRHVKSVTKMCKVLSKCVMSN